MRRIGIALPALVMVAVASMWSAPGAFAASESATVSTFAANSPVSGTATTVFDGSRPNTVTWIEVDFPDSAYTMATMAGSDPADCAAYGIQLLRNGMQIPIDTGQCQSGSGYDVNGTVAVHYIVVVSPIGYAPTAGDVISMTWGSNFISSVGAGPSTLYVLDVNYGYREVAVTPTSSGSNGGSSSAPVSKEILTLAGSPSGTACVVSSITGYPSEWLILPFGDQCHQSGSASKSGATLLGWATSPNFPVTSAREQVERHWGAIDEVFDGERMIFIPAGMATRVSGSNNLFPIWSA